MTEKKRVLFLCTGNSAHSQMAEGLLRSYAGESFDVASAGVSPSQVRPEAIEVMREVGIDVSNHRSKSVDEYIGQDFDYVVTVCDNAKQQCPIFPDVTTRIHWNLDDPSEAAGDKITKLSVFRRVRNELTAQLRLFIAAAGQ